MDLEEKLLKALSNPEAAEFQISKLEAEESLREFVKQSWHVVEPVRPLKWGWALDAICDHLEAVTRGEINRLLCNVPPGMMKSLLFRVFWPVWEWIQRPDYRYIGASYSGLLAIRDNRRARALFTSQWFQARWPHVKLGDLAGRSRFENTELGWMMATSVRGVGTGERGDRFVVDDANSVKKAESKADREETNMWLGEVVPSRLNDLSQPILVVAQRVHEDDVSGFILSSGLPYVHLMLPMEFEPERRCTTLIGFSDPRTEEGELLFPERFTQEDVDALKRQFRAHGGTYAEAGQLQQRPEPREGGMFRVDKFEIVDGLPNGVTRVATVRYWDKAGTDGAGDFTVGCKMSLLSDESFLIEDVVRGQWSAAKREKLIQMTAENDGVNCIIWQEQEPGSGGKDSVTLSIRNLAGYTARADRVGRSDGDKIARAEPYAAQVEIGNVKLLRGEWNHEWIEEHRKFPSSKYKDQVDAGSGAARKLMLRRKEEAPATPTGEKQENEWL